MAGRLKTKVVIITGGGDGFGAGIVDKFISEGAKVVIVDINEASAQKKAASYPGQAVALRGDVSKEDCWTEALQTAISQFGSLHVVVNNAGVVHPSKPSIEVTEQEYSRVFDVNVKPIYWSTKVIIPYFKENRAPGLFINVSSMSAARPRPNLVWYAASKGAVSTVCPSSLTFAHPLFDATENCSRTLPLVPNILEIHRLQEDWPESGQRIIYASTQFAQQQEKQICEFSFHNGWITCVCILT